MVDDAGHHEQGPLEKGMRHQIEHGGFDRIGQAEPGQHDQQAERRHRRIGQHHFEIRLAHGQRSSGNKGRHTEKRQQDLPLGRAAEHRVEPHEKIDARLHHRRRMQVSRDRSRRLHGIRQPEVKRKLCRLGEGAAEDKEQCCEIERALLQFVAERQEQRELGDAADVPDDDKPGQQGEPASARDHQGLQSRAARRLAPVIEADQQERSDGRQFPKDEEHQEAVRHDQPLHRSHEHQDEREEAALIGMSLQIAARIKDDQGPDARNQKSEGKRQAIDQPGEADVERRYPGIAAGDDFASGDFRNEAGEMNEDREWRKRQEPGSIPAEEPSEGRCDEGRGKGKTEGQKCQGRGIHRVDTLLLIDRSVNLPPDIEEGRARLKGNRPRCEVMPRLYYR